ncbi:MAG: hypothetical protein ACLSGI_12325 [Butyricicoccaceae bacterium]
MMVQLLIMVSWCLRMIQRLVCGIVTLGINSGVCCRIVRGGLMSVNPGQMEAGRSLGLNYAQTMRLIVARRRSNILPALGNEISPR